MSSPVYSRTTRYAFHLLGALTLRRGQRLSGEELARITGIPANYLSKILNQLRKHGFVDSRKGWGGGFELRPTALERPILEVLEVFEGPAAELDSCAFGLPECDPAHPCPLHDQWEEIRAATHRMLAQTRIADLGFDSG
ncbi:MAG TPA: Rrf2 family transcriptional regulator [Candidatus Sulfomarinibacteraceae bacterium]|nr:Rrf2 family transcriptional regulator [Candidatus Sulfomarinibacteraceae bacterium]